MSFGGLLEAWRSVSENGKYSILAHPRVLANLRLYEREFAARPTVMRSRPPRVEIELTNRCNLACVQCLRSVVGRTHRLGDMDPDDYRRVLARLPYAISITLNGFGEPLLYDRLFEVLEHTHRKRPWAKTGIYTNGMLLDDKMAERLVDSGLTEVDFSIDAATPEVYRRVRRGGKLETVHANLRGLVRAREAAGARFPLIGTNFVMVNDNEGELVPFIEQTAELGADFVNCISWASYDWGFVNARTEDSYLTEMEAARRRLGELRLRCKSMPEANTRWADPLKPFFCGFYWGEEFRVAYDGRVTLGCCTPFPETYAYGNVLDDTFDAIWNWPAIQRNREMANQHLTPNKTCASCDAYCKAFFSGGRAAKPGKASQAETDRQRDR